MNKLGWLFGAVLVAGLGVVTWQATQPATQSAGRSMTPPDSSRIEEGAPIVEISLPDSLSEDAQIGKRAFEAKCASCHGVNATGQNGIAPPLVHKIYEPGHHSDMAFVRAAKNGVRSHHWSFGDMPPVAGLTDAHVKYIARYVRELQRENGIE